MNHLSLPQIRSFPCLSLVLALLLASCQKESLTQISTDLSLADSARIPVALARNVALLEYRSGFPEAPDLCASDITVTTSPRLITSAHGHPLYYEFSYFKGDSCVGVLGTYATQAQPGVLAYVRPASDSLSSHPLAISSHPLALSENEWLAEFDQLEIDAMRAYREEARQTAAKESTAYWATMQEVAPQLMQANKPQLTRLGNAMQEVSLTKGGVIQTDEYVIPAYDAEAIQHTYWRGGCGPSAVANVYRGLYTHYNDVYLPVWGDAEFLKSNRFYYMDNAIYFYKDMRDSYTSGIPNLVNREWVEIMSAQMDNGLYASLCDFDYYYEYYKLPYLEDWGASLPCHLRRGLQRVTHGDYTLLLLNIEPHWHIRLYHLPVLLLSTEFNHYMVAYGTRYETWHWETLFNVLGKSWTVSSPKIILRKWFKINDNGYRTEPNGHAPYWMQDNVLNRFLFFGVRKGC